MAADLIYRARGIDLARDRDDDGNLIADDDRNIVLVQNTIAHNMPQRSRHPSQYQ